MPSRPDGFFVFRPLGACALQDRASMNAHPKLSVRCRPGNANHHLWNNHGTLWLHATVHLPDFTKRRLRLSLGTSDLQHARRVRDTLFALFGCAVSA